MRLKDRLKAADLSNQLGCYYRGTLPGCETVRLLSYSHRTEPKNEAPLYWFEDCAVPCDALPSLLPYTATEVSELLERV